MTDHPTITFARDCTTDTTGGVLARLTDFTVEVHSKHAESVVGEITYVTENTVRISIDDGSAEVEFYLIDLTEVTIQ